MGLPSIPDLFGGYFQKESQKMAKQICSFLNNHADSPGIALVNSSPVICQDIDTIIYCFRNSIYLCVSVSEKTIKFELGF